MEPEIQSILEPNEQIVWSGKQDLKTTLFSTIFIVIIIMIIANYISNMTGGSCKINWKPGTPEECAAFLHKIGSGFYLFGIIIPIFAYLYYKVTTYIITNKRAIIKSGVIGADIRTIYYEQVKTILVDVGLLGKIFGTGTVMMDTWRIRYTKNGSSIDYDKFSNIKNPYEVYKIIQEKLSSRREGLHSWRADFENAQNWEYKDYIQQVEKWKQEV